MALNSINTNVAAYYAQSNISKANSMSATSIGRLSSGDRIVNASDDVAGLAAGTSLATTVTTLRAALTNASQGSSLLQVADGALAEITDMLQRQKSLAVQAGSGSLTDVERGFLDQEFQALASEIDRLAEATTFNGVQLLNGTGISTNLAQTDASAAFFATGADLNNTAPTADDSTNAIEAFDVTDGTTRGTDASTAGFLQFVDASDTQLADAAYNGVNANVVGAIENIRIENVSYAVAGELVLDINGIEFRGIFADGATQVAVENGNTRIMIAADANGNNLDLTDENTVAAAEIAMNDDFADTRIARTSNITGLDFSGTRLDGTIGDAAAFGVAAVRLYSAGDVQISNFQYIGNSGAADTNVFTVEVNGTTFTAADISDDITAGDNIFFGDGTGQGLMIDFGGLANTFENANGNDIRTNAAEREAFLNALNVGFGNAGAGLDFAVGAKTSDSINVNIKSVTTDFLYGGSDMSLASASAAQSASEQLDFALDYVTSVRADVGAVQSRFNFASSNVEVAIQNQDAARGVFLDTDVAAESTSFATSQVQLQAGISVLAQANLLSQNLLKLIG